MLLDLPVELQQLVYQKMDVQDRVRFMAAMPKVNGIKRKCKDAERKLGILNTFTMKKKLVPRMSPLMLTFLGQQCDPLDPTVQEMAKSFPELQERFDKETQSFVYESFIQRIANNTLTKEYVEGLDQEDVTTQFKTRWENEKVVYSCKPETFHILYKHSSGFINWLRDIKLFIFNLFNCRNIELVEHLIANRDSYPLIDVTESLRMMQSSEILWYNTTPQVRRCMMKYIGISRAKLQGIFDKCMDTMNLDAALDLEGYLSGKNEFSENVRA